MHRILIGTLFGCFTGLVSAQQLSSDPFPTPIKAEEGVISANFVEFAAIPFEDDRYAPRLMTMTSEPGTQRLFVSAMTGTLYAMDYEGKNLTEYLNINDEKWGVRTLSAGNERGVQSFTFHPDFAKRGAPGYGKFYVYLDTRADEDANAFQSGGERRTHDTILLEWTALNADSAVYDGNSPREVLRAAQPFPNHNGGQIGFNPLATVEDDDFGLLYIGLADGGAGGDPLNAAQDLSNYFGKILRIDPLGNYSKTFRYGVPSTNPFAADNDNSTLGEIFAYGVRNPQRFTWDSKTGQMLLADIGQNQVEEISPVPAGGNLGWNAWEGSYRYDRFQVSLDDPQGEEGLVWPIVEYDHADPLFIRQVAITGITVYRGDTIAALQNKIIFGDNPSGEIFYVDADAQHQGGQDAIARILLNDEGQNKTLLQLIQEKNVEQGVDPASRADLRFGFGAMGEIFLLNKHDGVIRKLVE
ncbi:MAG: PQQ-dependent sugar dehydrogenase [Pseudohongiellaceae bacterium]|nr:PQQ-dependent sugar dehydrogenase [Pseudohongiellaceae bacterium]